MNYWLINENDSHNIKQLTKEKKKLNKKNGKLTLHLLK